MVAHLLYDIGRCHAQNGDYTAAIEYYQLAFAHQVKLGATAAIAVTLSDLGRSYALLGADSVALDCFARSLRISERLRANVPLQNTLHGMYQLYTNRGELRNAYAYYLRWQEHKDSVSSRGGDAHSPEPVRHGHGADGHAAHFLPHGPSFLEDAPGQERKRQLHALMEQHLSEQRERRIALLEKGQELQSIDIERQKEALRTRQLEAQRRKQEIALLSRTAEAERLRHAITASRLDATEAVLTQKQQEIALVQKDRLLQQQRGARENTLRAAIAAGVLLFLLSLLLLLRRMRDRQRRAALQARLAEAHALQREHDILRLRTRSEHREREEQQRFTRGLLGSMEEQRRLLAGELHDSLGQDLIVVKNQLLLLRETTSVNGDLDDSIDGVGGMLGRVRRLTNDLYPHQLDRYGIAPALRALAERATASGTVHCTVRIGMTERLPQPETEIALYRIAQEAVENILRHADAKTASIGIEDDDDEIILTIEDDGKGFFPFLTLEDSSPAPAAERSEAAARSIRSGSAAERSEAAALPTHRGPKADGLGLRGMAERAEMLGGYLMVDSRPGAGSRITVRLPVTTIAAPLPAHSPEPHLAPRT
jgi:signal transduction histidine kinase